MRKGPLHRCLGRAGRRARRGNGQQHGADARLALLLHSSTGRYLHPGQAKPGLALGSGHPGEQPANRIWKCNGGKEGEMLGEAMGSPLLRATPSLSGFRYQSGERRRG